MNEAKPEDWDTTYLNPSAADNSPPSPRDEGEGRGEIQENRPSSPPPSPPSEGGEGAAGPGASAKGVAPRRRWKRIIIACSAAVVLLFALPKLLDRQPRVQGHTVESWLLQTGDAQNMEQARLVLRGMGREAIPHIVKALGRRDNAFLDRYTALRDRLPSALQKVLPERAHPGGLRWCARYELERNPYTHQFLPEIIKLLDDPDTAVRQETCWLLHHMSKYGQQLDIAALPTLLTLLRDDHFEIRSFAALTIAGFGSNAVDVAPNLVRLLDDTNEVVSYGAAFALEAIHEWDLSTKLPTGVVVHIEKILSGATNQVLSNVTNR